MTQKEAILDFLARKKPEWERSFGITRLGLFGSFAQDDAHLQSDIDILIRFQQHIPGIAEKKKAIGRIIQQQFGRSVDVCNEKYIKPYYREAIQKQAVYV